MELSLAPFFSNDRNPFNYAKIQQVSRDTTTQWLTTEQITQQLNLFDDESQDGYVVSLELAVRFAIEDYLGISIFPTTYRTYYADVGSFGGQIYLDLPESSPGANGVTIDSVNYYYDDPNPTMAALSSSEYYYDPSGSRVVVLQLPTALSTTIANPLNVVFTVPANPIYEYPVVQHAGLLLLTHLYNNRSDTTVDKLKNIPFGVEALLRPYKPLVM